MCRGIGAPANAGKAIQRAGVTLGWQVTQTKPGHMTGALNLRKHVAVVDVP